MTTHRPWWRMNVRLMKNRPRPFWQCTITLRNGDRISGFGYTIADAEQDALDLAMLE